MRNKAWSCSLWENKRKEWKKNLGLRTKHRDGSADKDNSNHNGGIFFYFGLKDDDNSYLYDNLSLEAQEVETFPLLKQRNGCLCSET